MSAGNSWWSSGECHGRGGRRPRVFMVVRRPPKGVRGSGKVSGSPRERQVATTSPGVW